MHVLQMLITCFYDVFKVFIESLLILAAPEYGKLRHKHLHDAAAVWGY